MATLRIGTLTPSDLRMGTVAVSAAYLGTVQVWPIAGAGVSGTVTGIAKRPVSTMAATFTTAPAVTATMTATAQRATAALNGSFATPGAIVGAISVSSKNATSTINATFTTAPAITSTMTAAGQRPTPAINGLFGFTGTIAATGKNATAVINGTFSIPAVTGTLTGIGKHPTPTLSGTFTGVGGYMVDFTDDANGEPTGWTTVAGAEVGNATVISGVYRCPQDWWNSTVRYDTLPASTNLYITAEFVRTVSTNSSVTVRWGPDIAGDWNGITFADSGDVLAVYEGGGVTIGSWTPAALGVPFTIDATWNNYDYTVKLNGVSVATGTFIWGVAAGPMYTGAFIQGGSGLRKWSSGDVVTGPPTAPGTPTSLGASPGNGLAALSWSAPASNGGSAITDYTVQWRTTAGPGSWNTFSHTASTATSINVTGLTNGTGFDFQVAAVNSVGTSSYSSTASTTPTAGGSGTVTFRSQGTLVVGGGTMTTAKPAGVAAGDLLLIYCHSDDNTTMACTGFTAVGVATYTGFSSANRKNHFLWKIATGSEGSTFSVTGGGSSYNEALCFAYTGATGVGATGSTNNNFNSPALAVANNNSMEVAVLAFDNSSLSNAGPAGWTRRLNGDGTFAAWIAERAASAGTTTSSNFTGVGDTSNGYGMINIILTP